MTTRINTYRALAERLGHGKLDVIIGTATNTTNTAQFTDTSRLKYASADANAYDRCWVYAMEKADASTRGFARITDGGYTGSTGVVTYTGGTMSGFANEDLYVITQDPPDDLHDAINETLRNDYVESWFPLSMHVVQNDANDMEASTVATDYEIGTGAAALAIETAVVYSGSQSLEVTCDNANEYAALKSVIPVNEDMMLHAAAMCSVTQGDDAAFRVWDVTNNVEIDSATSDEPAWMNLQPPVLTIPSGCEQIDLRLEGIGSDDVVYWDEVQVWYDGLGVYPLPAYIQSPSQLLAVHAVPQGEVGPGDDNDYLTNEYSSRPLRWEWESKTPGSMRISVGCGDARPYLVTLRPRAELSTDSATTTANKDWVVAMAEMVIREPEEASRVLGDHKAAILTAPNTHVQPRVGTRIG